METPKTKELVCNCNEEFKTGPCPIHHSAVEVERAAIVNDEDLVPEVYRRWEGLVFSCPKCKEPSIIDFCKFCCNCGAEIIIQSKTLTEAINKAIESGNK